MKLSVLIACYNEEATLADQLEGLAVQQWSEPWEIVFIDNRSEDNSRTIAERYKKRLPNLKIIDAYEHQGKAFALNKGILSAKGRSIAFADADDQAAPGWLSAMGRALENHELVACRWDIKSLNNPLTQKYRGNNQLHGLQQINYPPYLPHAGGGSLGINRDLHFKIGGFDETLPHLEDTDYVWRAQLAGAKLTFVPDAVMRVRFREDLPGIYRQFRNYAEYNVFLSRKYRGYGEPIKCPWHKYFYRWLKLFKLARRPLKVKEARYSVARELGWQIGLLLGSIKYHVPPV
jgi:glycosyltransferase involved in cell wall biosynthesis